MRCNLRQPDVAPVVVGSNYEAHNASVHTFNDSARDRSAVGEHAKVVLHKRRNCYFRGS